MKTNDLSSRGTTRRQFLVQTAAMVAAAGFVSTAIGETAQGEEANAANRPLPWYRHALRWGQTNITERDVEHYDIAWWRQHWKRTAVQGVIINAGGIFAYYPSKFPLHYRPPTLKDRDLYGELAKAAQDDGLAVLARMDSSKAHEALYKAHPDWFGVDAAGTPYRSGEFYLSCINGPYYTEFLPGILREIIERSHPNGITDNIWSGLERNSICYCRNCAEKFHTISGKELPARRDWDDAAYRQWIDWNYARRIEQWDFNNKVTRDAGGADCIWVGMNGSSVASQANSFRDMKEICARAEIIMLDNQSRSDAAGFGENTVAGKLIHSLLGAEKLIPESMAMYQHGRPQFRFSSKSAPEARMWMLAGFAGGIQPWWHHVGAYHEDRRMYRTAEPLMRWHAEHEQLLVNRRPVASVAVGWSQRNMDFFGRDDAEERVEQPWRGMTQALMRARIPFVPIHLDHLDRDGQEFSVLVLPNIGVLTDEQVDSIRKFAARGGALVATGQTGQFDRWGDARSELALADLFGVKGKPAGAPRQAEHTYLRLTPELRAQVYGPTWGDEPVVSGKRHAILTGFEETDILPFGGMLSPLEVSAGAKVLLTFIPAFPATPPETSWMRTPRTEIPGLVLNETQTGRVVYMPADIDRRFALDNFPDHGDLLANAVRWAAKDSIALDVQGPGLLNCELYRQGDRMILHIVNFTSAGTWRAPVQELIPVGPMQVKVRWDNQVVPKSLRLLVVGGDNREAKVENGWIGFELKSIVDHEVVVIEA